MEVLDLIQSAAFKSGVVPSFNPDGLPDDVLDAGHNVLAEEILPSLNCDRTIDVTVTSKIYTPVDGKIVLTPFEGNKQDFKILGYSKLVASELVENFVTELANFDITAETWPVNDFGEWLTLAIWSSDTKLVYASSLTNASVMNNVNIDFPPMRIDAVLENTSRVSYQYLYRDEFERSKPFVSVPGVYTVEEHENSIIILINGSPEAKCVVIPVPLQIVNRDASHPGTIIAPPKFKRYLIDSTAVALATIYGVSTLPIMKEAASVSYNLLKKNKTQPLHKANTSEEICDKLRYNVLGRRYYANF